jgi:hypothetical protein
MTKSTQLMEQLRSVGHKMDGPNDVGTMKFLLHGRCAIRAALEAARPSEPLRFTEQERQIACELNMAPFLFTGMNDGMACYED